MSKTYKNTNLAINLLLLACGMLGLAYASVPLYRIFCDITGYGGTTQTAQSAPVQATQTPITVTFNADINEDLPWTFKPGAKKLTALIGEQILTHYTAENLTDQPITGRAIYNVTPFAAGAYFNKIECFCFTEQTLKPREKVDMPILFYIDPEILNDPDMKNISTITLSYTFFPLKTDNSYNP